MKEGNLDKILTKMTTRIDGVTDKIAIQTKGVKPFDTVEISGREKYFMYSQLTPDEQLQLASEVGTPFLKFRKDMEAMRGKYNA